MGKSNLWHLAEKEPGQKKVITLCGQKKKAIQVDPPAGVTVCLTCVQEAMRLHDELGRAYVDAVTRLAQIQRVVNDPLYGEEGE